MDSLPELCFDVLPVVVLLLFYGAIAWSLRTRPLVVIFIGIVWFVLCMEVMVVLHTRHTKNDEAREILDYKHCVRGTKIIKMKTQCDEALFQLSQTRLIVLTTHFKEMFHAIAHNMIGQFVNALYLWIYGTLFSLVALKFWFTDQKDQRDHVLRAQQAEWMRTQQTQILQLYAQQHIPLPAPLLNPTPPPSPAPSASLTLIDE